MYVWACPGDVSRRSLDEDGSLARRRVCVICGPLWAISFELWASKFNPRVEFWTLFRYHTSLWSSPFLQSFTPCFSQIKFHAPVKTEIPVHRKEVKDQDLINRKSFNYQLLANSNQPAPKAPSPIPRTLKPFLIMNDPLFTGIRNQYINGSPLFYCWQMLKILSKFTHNIE